MTKEKKCKISPLYGKDNDKTLHFYCENCGKEMDYDEDRICQPQAKEKKCKEPKVLISGEWNPKTGKVKYDVQPQTEWEEDLKEVNLLIDSWIEELDIKKEWVSGLHPADILDKYIFPRLKQTEQRVREEVMEKIEKELHDFRANCKRLEEMKSPIQILDTSKNFFIQKIKPIFTKKQ